MKAPQNSVLTNAARGQIGNTLNSRDVFRSLKKILKDLSSESIHAKIWVECDYIKKVNQLATKLPILPGNVHFMTKVFDLYKVMTVTQYSSLLKMLVEDSIEKKESPQDFLRGIDSWDAHYIHRDTFLF